MNFLEELVAEWYQYRGYFVRRNVKIGKLGHGGYEGEMDVLAFSQDLKEFLHIEASTDSLTWDRRRERFLKKFQAADKQYKALFGRRPDHRIVIVGLGRSAKQEFGPGIETRLIPEFVAEVSAHLAKKNPLREAVPEGFPLLRAIQYAMAYGVRE